MSDVSAVAEMERPAPARSIPGLRHWPLWLGLLLVGGPTIVSLGEQSWSTELGAHGLIVFATGLWLVSLGMKRIPASAKPGALAITLPLLCLLLAVYVFGRAFDFISLEAGGLYLIGILAVWHLVGLAGLRELAFPLFYLGFLVPPPGWLIDEATAPLQNFVSMVATNTLSMLGYPVARSGVTIFIAQYQMLVEQACSGMNSLLGLTAIMLFYIYMLHRSSWRYAVVLVLFILPIAVVTNIIRVMGLVLIAYYLGEEAAQGFLHMTAGIVLFAVALALALGLDSVLRPIWNRTLARARG
jgi:exosortase